MLGEGRGAAGREQGSSWERAKEHAGRGKGNSWEGAGSMLGERAVEQIVGRGACWGRAGVHAGKGPRTKSTLTCQRS